MLFPDMLDEAGLRCKPQRDDHNGVAPPLVAV